MALFDNLLNQPESYRKKVAYLSTAILAIIITVAWLMIASQDIRQSLAPANNSENRMADEAKKKLPSLEQNTVQTQLMKEGQGIPTDKSFDSLNGFDSQIIERK